MPVLDAERIHSSYLYYDAQVDDARMTMAIARTAALDHGAVVCNHAPVVALRKGEDGRLVGATVDAQGHGRIDVRARAVVNAAGVWIDTVDQLDGVDAAQDMRPARGVHVVVPRGLLRNDAAVILSVPGKRASVFAVPWGDHTYIGPPTPTTTAISIARIAPPRTSSSFSTASTTPRRATSARPTLSAPGPGCDRCCARPRTPRQPTCHGVTASHAPRPVSSPWPEGS